MLPRTNQATARITPMSPVLDRPLAVIDRRAHEAATKTEIAALAEKLQATLGQRLTAFAAQMRDPKMIGRYARGTAHPRSETEKRLRNLFQVTSVLLEVEPPATARAW